jgi:DNA repair protein SbcC/Rad50
MIPIKISIEGFLSYRQRQEIDLSDMQLCMLSGPNGSGKSSVFDALTIALFNTHRAGKSGREDLINKKCDKATIEVDFELRGVRWKARRTLPRKGTATQVISRWSESKNAWELVPDTTSARGYENWVKANVGVSAETFTSSMLLRQGQADRLLMAQPRERAELLGTVVGLDQYKALHERVSDQRKSRKHRLDDLEVQLAAMPQVSDERLEGAASDVKTTQDALTAAERNVERLQPLLEQSKQWAKLQGDVLSAEAEHKVLEGLLSRTAEIERDAARLRELDGLLPKLCSLTESCANHEQSLAKVKDLILQREERGTSHTALVGEITTAQEAQVVAMAEVKSLEDRDRVVALRLTEVKAILDHAEAIEKQQSELAVRRAELARLPATLDRDLEKARAERQRLADLSEAWAWLTQMANHRRTIHDAQQPLGEQRETIETTKVDLGKVAVELEAVARDHVAAETAQRAAQEQDAHALAELKHARTALKALEEANGKTVCPTCGHELTSDHLADEQTRRRVAEKGAMDARAAAAKALQTVNTEHDRLRRRRTELDAKRTQLDSRFQQATRDARNLGDDIDKAVKQCCAAFRELSQAYRDRVGDKSDSAKNTPVAWLATSWPTEPDLIAIKEDLATLPNAKEHAAQCETAFNSWNRLKTQIETLGSALANQPSAGDVAPLRAEQNALTDEQVALKKSIADDHKCVAKQKKDVESLQKRVAAIAKQVSELEAALAGENARIESYAQAIVTCSSELIGDWATMRIDRPLLDKLAGELKQLKNAGAEQTEKRLKEAQSRGQAIAATLALLRRQIDAIPADARCEPTVIQGQLDTARAQRELSQKARQDAHNTLARLRQEKEARAAKDEQRKQLAREHEHYNLLSDLLGRDGLQRHLMREAERAIVKYANDILTPISGGDLLLRLRGNDGNGAGESGDDDHALDLEAYHTRISNADAIAVSFLSGSQQFRVAVALALAIGQYAGGGNRLGECVIIDEGFGSLDSQGQDVMIEELQRLQGIMKRIILVSHQESFANAFPTGIRFRLENGETRVLRLSQ